MVRTAVAKNVAWCWYQLSWRHSVTRIYGCDHADRAVLVVRFITASFSVSSYGFIPRNIQFSSLLL